MWPNPQFSADLVTFTEEILNGKLHFLCSGPRDDWSTGSCCPSRKIHTMIECHPGSCHFKSENCLNFSKFDLAIPAKTPHSTWMFITTPAVLKVTIIALNFRSRSSENIVGLHLFVPIVKLVWGFSLLSSDLYVFTHGLIVLSLSLQKTLLNFDTALEFPFSQAY